MKYEGLIRFLLLLTTLLAPIIFAFAYTAVTNAVVYVCRDYYYWVWPDGGVSSRNLVWIGSDLEYFAVWFMAPWFLFVMWSGVGRWIAGIKENEELKDV